MNFSIESNAQTDVKLAINWLSKKMSYDKAKNKIIALINDIKNQLILHPHSGKKCSFDVKGKYREIIKGDYRTIYKIDNINGETEITIIVFCHVRMNFQTLLSQSNIYTGKFI
ncbi:MAG: type II toxin-antitoxin system RelE/ParE family toxin [Alteromonadaceae bacterium]|nr:type II toxin-antitoxin system RelE/ParE family toxin [Alteromonadaceae bacterium]